VFLFPQQPSILRKGEKKMNKSKFFIALALLAITSMVLSACATPQTPAPAATAPAATEPAATSAPAATAAPVTLTIWHNYGPDDAKGPTFQAVLKEFMAANPDITIKDEVYVDVDIPVKVETAFTANQEPDLVFAGRVGSPTTWTDAGIALPVNDLIKEWGFDGLFKEGALKEYTLADGKIQAFPFEGYTWPIWYNKAVFEKAGVAIPTTTDELITAAKAIRAAGDQPVIASGSDGMGLYLFTLTLQSQLTDEEAKQCLGDGDWTVPNCIKAVNLFVQLRDAGVFVDGVEGLDYPTAGTNFYAGNVAMSHFGAWDFANAPKELLPNIQLGGFPLPAGSPHKAPVIYSSYSAKAVWITPNGAAKMDAVKRFIQFLYKPEIMARFVENSGMTPALIDVPVDASKLNPLFVQSLTMPVEVAMTPDDFFPPKVQADLGTGKLSQTAFTKGTTAEQILTDLTNLYQSYK
jgi:multiple sugar transport system substrate-binding protein